jgi:hypothetical protein
MSAEALAYYRASLTLLKHVESRQPTSRRFGGEADALWSQFRGHLTTADRITTLLRDADAQWPGGFGARSIFQLRGVAEDDAFGSQWQPLDGVDAEDIWREFSVGTLGSTQATLQALASVWKFSLAPISVDNVDATEHLVVAGPSAVAALIQAFDGRSDLNWADQVTAIASLPAHRHLALAAAALLNLTRAPLVLSADQDAGLVRSTTKPRLFISADASEADAVKARALAE